MLMKMSSDSKIIKPKTDFQLVLNYSNQRVWKNESGAGANAVSRAVDMTFSSTDGPLSEIVWSPSKGFSLNCVDSSFDDKNSSVYRDVEPSSMVLALIQSVTGCISTTAEPLDDVFVKPISTISTKNDISSSGSPTKHPKGASDGVIQDCRAHEEHNTGSGGNMEKMYTARRVCDFSNDQANVETAIISEIKGNKSSNISGHVDHGPVDNSLKQADEPQPSMELNPSPRKHSNGVMDSSFGKQVVVTEDSLYTEVEHINESDALKSPRRSPLEKLESSAENNLQTFNCEATCAAKSGVLVSQSSENKNKCQGNEMVLLCDKNLPVTHSPRNSNVPMTRYMGEEKSLSDIDASKSLSKEENDSCTSVESCYCADMLSIGKKRCSFQQQLIVGSKRVKRQIQETSHSKSYVQQDSSFMNLFSNMRKRFSRSTHDEGKSSTHTTANPDHHLWPDPKLITCNNNQDTAPQHTGLKSNFHSTYCPSLKNVGTRNSHEVGEASKESDISNKVHEVDVTARTFCAEKNSLYKQYFQSNKIEVSTQRYDSSPSLHSKVRPINFLDSHENRKKYSVETKSCYHLELIKEKEGMTLHSSSTRQNKNSNDNLESYASSERHETTIFHKSDNLEGMSISRFSPKSTTPLMICDHLKETGGSQIHSTDFSMLRPSHERITYLNNFKIEETREQYGNNLLLTEANKLQNCCVNKKASTGLKGNNDHTSSRNFSPITPFPGFSDSVAMAPMFARRLGAIKHMPTNRTDSISHR
ncbi:PREDICTED: uncharacterized protein LOC109335907 isoform X2 [Lupinus angustifolius]|nr:PREDICTED: uncharacterized protein LOC109335907 isoform X2 [Lupinus angustifolius]